MAVLEPLAIPYFSTTGSPKVTGVDTISSRLTPGRGGAWAGLAPATVRHASSTAADWTFMMRSLAKPCVLIQRARRRRAVFRDREGPPRTRPGYTADDRMRPLVG